MTASGRLPSGYEALEPFVDEWALAGSRERTEQRHTSTIEEIRGFYEAMMTVAERGLGDLSQRQLGALEPEWECLLRLFLSLAEVGPAVEWYGRPGGVDGLPHRRFPMTLELPDLEAQEARR
jgi:hypothetical protein